MGEHGRTHGVDRFVNVRNLPEALMTDRVEGFDLVDECHIRIRTGVFEGYLFIFDPVQILKTRD